MPRTGVAIRALAIGGRDRAYSFDASRLRRRPLSRANNSRHRIAPRAPTDLSPWSAKGKLSVQGPQGSETARFHWQRPDADHDVIVLSGPLSLNQQTIRRTGEETLWMEGDIEKPLTELARSSLFTSDTALISPAVLGTWLLGAPSPSPEWTVTVTQWQPAGQWEAPSRVIIRHDDMEIRVVITKWHFSPLP